MKNVFYIVITFIFLVGSMNAQEGMGKHHNVWKKIEHLEKLKLMEILDISEENMVKFLNRRHEYNEKTRNLLDQRNEIINKIESKLKDDESEAVYKKLNAEICGIEDELAKLKCGYYSSLSSLLTQRQISKVLLFDRNFRSEIKTLLYNNRHNKNKNNK